jgi:hypothetical protein
MAKFLVINRPPTRHPKRDSATAKAAAAKCVSHFMALGVMDYAKVFPIVGLKGYATLVDVADHEHLKRILSGNPMGNEETYTVMALGDLND